MQVEIWEFVRRRRRQISGSKKVGNINIFKMNIRSAQTAGKDLTQVPVDTQAEAADGSDHFDPDQDFDEMGFPGADEFLTREQILTQQQQ